jgi:phosphoglycolate phosphatase
MDQEFEAVIFDFDYTLGDSSAGIIECINYALSVLGLPPETPERIRRTIGLSLVDAYAYLAGPYQQSNPDRAHAEKFARLFIERADEIMVEQTELYPGVDQLIATLRQAGFRLGIVSTKFRYRIAAILKRERLLHAFDVIVGGEDVAHHKPDPESLYLAVQKLGIAPEYALYVGDSVTDGQAAQRAGLPFVAVLSGVTPEASLAEYAPLAILDSATDLAGLLQSSVNHRPT